METFSCLQIILQLFTKQDDGKEPIFVCFTTGGWYQPSLENGFHFVVEKYKENR